MTPGKHHVDGELGLELLDEIDQLREDLEHARELLKQVDNSSILELPIVKKRICDFLNKADGIYLGDIPA